MQNHTIGFKISKTKRSYSLLGVAPTAFEISKTKIECLGGWVSPPGFSWFQTSKTKGLPV